MNPQASTQNVLPLAGQVALVTGASSGIGAGIASGLAAAGARVAINHPHTPAPAEEVAKQIREAGGEVMLLAADVSKEDEVVKMYANLYQQFGTIDILIANAGLQRDSPLVDMKLTDWQLVLDVNLTGQFLCAREATREFLRRGVKPEVSVAAGKIICISSVHEIIPWGGHCNYASSKGGLMLLVKSMAQELAPQRIRVNSIAPGAIKTPINKSAWDTPEAEANLLKLIPYGRIGTAATLRRPLSGSPRTSLTTSLGRR